jgi:uroporphyrinogen decarboxylase
MTSREIVLANLEHDAPPRPGLTFDRGRLNDMIACSPGPSASYTPRRWAHGPKEYYDDEWGSVWVRMVDGSLKGEIHEPVLTDWGQLDDLRLPDYEAPSRYARMAARFREERERFRLACIGGWIFDNARYLRRMEVYFADMALHPAELKRLHARVAEVYEAKILGAARAGADGIMIGEDMGTQQGLLFSPTMWREFFRDDYTRLFGLAHDCGMKVLMHSCGCNWEILDDLIDAGVDCFQFDQPALYDMPALAAKFRDRQVALWSPVDIQKVMPTGDRAFIEAEAERLVRLFAGGLLLKNYGDLHGIGVEEAWDDWAYARILEIIGLGS